MKLVQPINFLAVLAASAMARLAWAATLSGAITINPLDPLPSGEPLELSIAVKNTGDQPMTYWCGGPDRCPGAEHFIVHVTLAGGKLQALSPTNGQYVQGSGMGRQIAAGTSMTVPLAMPPLPPGKYTIAVAGVWEGFRDSKSGASITEWPATSDSPVVEIEVKDNAAIRVAYEQGLQTRIDLGEVFARHVATQYRVQSIIDHTMQQLISNDSKAALTAVQTLFDVRPPPPNLDGQIAIAIHRQLGRPKGAVDDNLCAWLLAMAGEEPTDRVLDEVLAAAGARDRFYLPEIRGDAVSALRNFAQPKAEEALRKYLADPDVNIRNAAQNAIDHPWPPL